jgi:NAD(P)-dependent dehydrogenase (short-subunit alcohol dehydrogenase family)
MVEDLPLSLHRLDVTDEASVAEAVELILAEVGRIDVAVNNAAISHYSPLEHTSDTQLRTLYDTNVLGPLRVIRAVLPTMRAQRSGAIVNISSIAAHLTMLCTGPYSMTKHALEAASETLALEVRPFGIRVAIIEPGLFATRMAPARSLGADPASPYADAERRVRRWFRQAKDSAGDPLVVAQVIEHAATTDEPQLRYLIGADAALFVHGRERISDEDWIELGRPMSDEQFLTEFAAHFPIPASV